MAGNIKGITIEFRGETTNLQKAIRTVDGELKKTQDSLKNVNKSLKFNPSNVELLKQKQGLLKEEISKTQEKLIALRKAQTEYNNSGIDKNSAEYQKLRREIIETESKLKTFTAQARELNNVTFTALGKSLQEVGGKLQDIGSSVKGVGDSMTQHLTLPIVAALGGSAKAFIDWESAFTGVMKTVDETATTSYADIEEGIKKLATETASSKNEIAGVAEVAGQLGVSADDVVDFTRVMVMLGDTTSLSSEEAAISLARIMNITGDTGDNIDELGSTIVALGNNFATNESEIVAMANRLASSGKLAGLTTQEIFALSTAMSSVGIQAEAGGTAMTQTLTAMESEVANFRSGAESSIEEFARISGMSAEEFANAWESAPITAIQSFISGLGELDQQGESATLILDELGLSGIRQSNMLKSLALASDTLSGAVEVANGSYEENVALTDEASKRYQTMSAQISQAKEKITEVAISIGQQLMPYIQRAIDFVKQMVDRWNNMSEGGKQVVITIGLIIATIGPLLSIIGTVIGVLGTLTTVAGALGVTIGTIAAPILIVIGAIAGLIAIGVALYKNWDTIKEKAIELWNYLKETFENIKQAVSEKINALKEKVSSVFQSIKDNIITPILNAKERAVSTVQNLRESIQEKIESIKSRVSSTFEAIKEKIISPFQTAKEKVDSIIQTIKGWFPFNLGKILDLKLPHISLTGGVAPFGIGGKGSLPHFNVDWYKQGGIFTKPSVIGVGEAGNEAVLPLDKFWNRLDGLTGGNTINMSVVVNGAEDPEQYAKRLVKELKLELRSL